MNHLNPVIFTWQAWLYLEDDQMSMDEAERHLIALGNVILERDDVGRRFKVMDSGPVDATGKEIE